jgi:hypothetical protein
MLVGLGNSVDRIPAGGADAYRALGIRTHLKRFSRDEADALMYCGYLLTMHSCGHELLGSRYVPSARRDTCMARRIHARFRCSDDSGANVDFTDCGELRSQRLQGM